MQRIYSVSLTKNFFSETVILPQYDENYQLVFHFVNNEYKSSFDGKSAYFEGTRNDGLSFRYSTVVSGNTATFVIDRALTAINGEHKGQIVLYDNTGLRFGSSNVKILVEKAARPDNAIDADVEEARAIAEQVQEIVDTAAERVEATYSELADRVTTLEQGGSGLTAEAKAAILACFRGVAWRSDVDSAALYSALDTALNPPANLSSISAVYTQSGSVYIMDSLDLLRSDLVVTAHYSDETSEVVDGYTLSGSLAEVGTSTITVTYGGKTTTFTVTVTSEWTYVWDLTNSLTDSVSGVTAVASAGTGVDAPTITSNGLVFNAATQRLSLGNINLDGKTIELDILSFDFVGSTTAHIRFLMNNTNSGPIIYHKDNGWSAYGLPASGGSTPSWSSTGWWSTSLERKEKNHFNGKTVRLVNHLDNTRELYLDGELVSAMTDKRYSTDTQDLSIGGTSGYSQSAGDQCYNMTISAIRIKDTEET